MQVAVVVMQIQVLAVLVAQAVVALVLWVIQTAQTEILT
jgi:hypothetical protein